MKIAFIGASGMLGKPVARQLIADGHTLTMIGRDETKLQELFPGADVKKADVFDRDSLVNAFKGNELIYLNLSVKQSSKETDKQTEREGIENIIAAAKETGIKRILYISSLVHFYEGMNGFSWWAFQIKNAAIEKIKNSGIPYTIFYPSTFMETYPYQMLMGKRIGAMGKSVMPMWFIAADDYAKQVSRSLNVVKDAGKEYYVQGPEALTFDQANKIFIENYSKARLSVMRLPIGMARFMGIFVQKMNYGWHICEALNKYPEKFKSQQTWDELGTPSIRLADFAKSL